MKRSPLIAAVLVAGCGTVPLAPKEAGQPKPAFEFDRVEVTVMIDPHGMAVQPQIRGVVTSGKDVDELASYFPEIGQGKTGDVPAGWDAAAEFKFFDKEGKEFRAWVDIRYQVWSEGNGDWKIQRYDPGLFVSTMKALKIG
jgi:hypothetical protein